MVDRRSSINYINEKYHGRGNVHGVAPSVVYNNVSHHTTTTPGAVVHVEEDHIPDVPVSQPATIVDNRVHSKGFRICGCPWWLCLLLTLLGLLLLGLLIGFLTGLFGDRKHTVEGPQPQGDSQPAGQVNGGTPETGCAEGFFPHNGKCISCPQGSKWNGTNCVKITSHLSRKNL